MTKRRGIGLVALTSAAVIGLSVLGAGTAGAGGGGHGGGGSGNGDPVVYATGLNNPRQLSFTPSGDLLIAEAGTGGAGPCFPNPEGSPIPNCYGESGSVSKVTPRGVQSRVLDGLPSIGEQDTGASSIGPSDVYSDGWSLSVLIGLGMDPAKRAELPTVGQRMGTLIQITRDSRTFRTVADIAAFEAAQNPIDNPDSDPVGMVVDGGRYVVADAGGNTVVAVSPRGRISLLAAFEDRMIDPGLPGLPNPFPMQAVPTSVATKGWDGAYYVSQLTGFPFPKGAANIYRIDQRGHVRVYASNLTNVTDLAFNGRDLYAVQISNEGLRSGVTGSVVKVHPGNANPTIIQDKLDAPYGIAVRNGYAYVTTGSVAPGAGQVIKFRL